MAARAVLYTIPGCSHCDAAREDLEWRGIDFEELDVESDEEALQKMLQMCDGSRTVPVIAEDGKPVQIGWMGRGCSI